MRGFNGLHRGRPRAPDTHSAIGWRAFVATARLLMDPDRRQQAHAAAVVHGASMAACVREAMRQVTLEDFPPSWWASDSAPRSHEAGYVRRKFGLRRDEETSRKLETLPQAQGRSAVEVVRQLIAHATPEDFLQNGHMAISARRP
jgi:hypothetical protein